MFAAGGACLTNINVSYIFLGLFSVNLRKCKLHFSGARVGKM